MASPAESPATLVLVISGHDEALASVIQEEGYVVARTRTGQLALDIARDTKPDVIVIDAELPDMSGMNVCRILRHDTTIGRSVPILMAVRDQPTPEQRVNALRAGAWDFLRLLDDPTEVSLKLRAYAHAKRSIAEHIETDLVDAEIGLRSSTGLARSALQLGAMMFRLREAMACVVFEWDADPPHPRAGALVARAARASDVVGVLSASRFGILAPATNHAGAVRLAARIAATVRREIEQRSAQHDVALSGSRLLVGYDAVSNAAYSPVNPMSLIAHATAAVRSGSPEPEYLWVRRHTEALAAIPTTTPPSRSTLP